jgi:hypothetical protein
MATGERDGILELTARYARAVDRKDEALLARCMAASVKATGSGEGPMGAGLAEALADGAATVPGPQFASMLVAGLRRMGATQHLFANHEVAWRDGDHATVTFAMRALHFAVDRSIADSYEVGGFYEHDVVRAGDEWRIEWWRLDLVWERGDLAVLG